MTSNPFKKEQSSSDSTKTWKQARPLWHGEVLFILQNYLDAREEEDKVSDITQNSIIQRTLEYVRRLNLYDSKENLTFATKYALFVHFFCVASIFEFSENFFCSFENLKMRNLRKNILDFCASKILNEVINEYATIKSCKIRTRKY